MFKHSTVFSMAAIVVLGVLAPRVPGDAIPVSGPLQIDSRHSYAQIITDGTTDFGKKKIDITLGFARLNGQLKLDDIDPAKSRLDFRIYPANSMAPPITEDGSLSSRWLANLANHTLVCFHSRSVVWMPDGKLQVTGDLTVTRVDRNVDATPNEGYAGPVYGPPMVHRVTREARFVLDLSTQAGKRQQVSAIQASTSTKIMREDFPQLVQAVVSTYWPPLIQDESCQVPATGEAYSGQKCTGTFLETPGPPQSPYTRIGEDYPGAQDFNSVVGERLTIQVQMHLIPQSARESTAGSN